MPKVTNKSKQLPSIRLSDFPLEESVKSLSIFKQLKLAETALRLAKRQPITTSVAKHIQNMCEKARESAIRLLKMNETNPDAVAVYCASCILVAYSFLLETLISGLADADVQRITSASLRALDLAMLRGGMEVWCAVCKPIVDYACRVRLATAVSMPKSISVVSAEENRDNVETKLPPQYLLNVDYAMDIPRIDSRNLSVEEFSKQFMDSNSPVILTHAIDDWPALKLWRDLEYLKVGRLVPVETTSKDDAGRSFMSESWNHEFMGLDDYIEKYVKDGGRQQDHAYLAQYPLFEQVPDLRNDIDVPIFCKGRTRLDDEAPSNAAFATEPLVSAWFGGKGTVSPIHNDPYENTLAQIIGTKYIRIYDTKYSHRLYPVLNHLGHNSQVDIDAPDFTRFPLFRKTPCWQTILKPGELLYIPRNAWHYVRSLETSFSASFWFGAKMELVEKKKSATQFTQKYLTR